MSNAGPSVCLEKIVPIEFKSTIISQVFTSELATFNLFLSLPHIPTKDFQGKNIFKKMSKNPNSSTLFLFQIYFRFYCCVRSMADYSLLCFLGIPEPLGFTQMLTNLQEQVAQLQQTITRLTNEMNQIEHELALLEGLEIGGMQEESNKRSSREG